MTSDEVDCGYYPTQMTSDEVDGYYPTQMTSDVVDGYYPTQMTSDEVDGYYPTQMTSDEVENGYYPTQMERRDWSDSFVYVTIATVASYFLNIVLNTCSCRVSPCDSKSTTFFFSSSSELVPG